MTPPVPTRDGATVMLVRDGHHAERPLEVFMLRRHPRTAFGSVHVFLGGVLDAADHDPALVARVRGLSGEGASERLGLHQGGLASCIAAVRESFEEAGVLLACHPDGTGLRLHSGLATRLAEHRVALHAGQRSLLAILDQEDLVLDLGDMHYVAHWITPEGAPKRYDTRFFLARAPLGQVYAHDNEELISSEWVRPPDALARHEAGGFAMIFPTISCLEDIGRFATTDEVMARPPTPPTRANLGVA